MSNEEGASRTVATTWPILVVIAVVALFLVVAAVVLIRPEAGEPEPDAAPPLLPRVTLEVNEQGVPSVLGISAETVGDWTGMDLSPYYLPEETVQRLTGAGVQHLELVVAGEGIFPFVNGQPFPYLATDEESWNTISQALELFQVDSSGVGGWFATNVLPRMGLPIVVQLPVPEDAEAIPLRQSDQLPRVDVEATRSAITSNSLVALADVAVDADGAPSLAGISLGDLQEALNQAGLAVDLSAARIDPKTVATLTTANVQHVQAETEPEGIYLYLNGSRLPRITWDEVRLQNALELYEALEPMSQYLDLAEWLLPGVQPASVELIVFFPKEPEAAYVAPSPFVSSQ